LSDQLIADTPAPDITAPVSRARWLRPRQRPERPRLVLATILTAQLMVVLDMSIVNVALPTLLPGITLQTSPSDFAPIEQMELERFDGKSWVLLKDR
jgi:hypothetical protein